MQKPIVSNWSALALGVVACLGFDLSRAAEGAKQGKPLDPGVQAACDKEKPVKAEENSREMARSATREIARSERRHAEESLRAYREASPEMKKEKLTALRAAEERLVADTITANKAARELFVAEIAARDAMSATRDAELQVKMASGAQRDALELRTLREMETQQWAAIRKDTAQELAEQSGEAARIAREIAAVEPEQAKKRQLEKLAVGQVKERADADAIAAEAVRDVEAMVPKIYKLRAELMGGLTPLAPEKWDYAKARHLLVRAGFGGTPQEVERLRDLGLYKAVDFLTEFYRQPQTCVGFDATPILATDPLESKKRMRGYGNRAVGYDRTDANANQLVQIRRWWLQRMVETPRPLQEKLTLFWHGHFAAQNSVVQNSYTMFRQLQFFREHAAGNFGALLYGLVHDPAMIRYLDNNKNAKGKPNENLAREIMELFSMGVDQGYTEHDILEAARALTGYNYDNATGTFRYVEGQHDPTNKTIFGKTGPWTGDDLVRLILEQPATSRFIAKKLFEYFAYPEPDTATVDRLAAVLKDQQFAIEPTLKNLFLSEEFYTPRAMGNVIKDPVELMVGILRDLGAKPAVANLPIETPRSKGDGSALATNSPVTNYEALDLALQQMGMQLLEPPDVKGWRYGRSWISSQRMFIRYNAVASVVDAVADRGVDLVAFLQAGACKTSADAVDYLARACLMRPLSAEKRGELIARLGDLPPCRNWAAQRSAINARLRPVLVLMLCMPEFQLT